MRSGKKVGLAWMSIGSWFSMPRMRSTSISMNACGSGMSPNPSGIHSRGGALTMRLLLLSDVHANLEAMEACLAAAPPYDRVVNLGDVVGYNASPNEVCELVRAMGGSMVRGNHDRACTGLTDLSEFNLVAAISSRWTQTTLASEHLDWLRNLPQGPTRVDELPGLAFVHGSRSEEHTS